MEFVTRKIVNEVAKIHYGLEKKIKLGNINAKRDWGYAPEYVDAMHRMLQSDKADDYVIATDETHTVEEFLKYAFEYIENPMKDTYVYYTKADIRKTEEMIGFKAKISLDEGIDKLIKYYNY